MAVVAGKIGSNEFMRFELEPAQYSSVIETLKRPGTDYHAYKLQGFEYPEQELHTQQVFSSHTNAVAAASTYNNYVGTNQALVRGTVAYGTYKFLKPPGSGYPRITPPRALMRIVGDPGGNTNGYTVEAVFLVQRVA